MVLILGGNTYPELIGRFGEVKSHVMPGSNCVAGLRARIFFTKNRRHLYEVSIPGWSGPHGITTLCYKPQHVLKIDPEDCQFDHESVPAREIS
jgi:hypothetical protein